MPNIMGLGVRGARRSFIAGFVCLSVAVLFGYIARRNALENTCTIYRVVNGQPEALSSQNVKVASNTWHTLRVEAGGDQFVVDYDGKKGLDAKDGTFKDAGKVGLWTKADSIVYFDDFSMVRK